MATSEEIKAALLKERRQKRVTITRDDKGTEYHLLGGKLHRLDGPAVCNPAQAIAEHWIDGENFSVEDFYARVGLDCFYDDVAEPEYLSKIAKKYNLGNAPQHPPRPRVAAKRRKSGKNKKKPKNFFFCALWQIPLK